MKEITILYVEDDINLSNQYAKYLESLCDKLLFAPNGKRAYDIYVKLSPDIIITDIKMPKMSGIELINNIRQFDTNIPIIVTSAFNDIDFLLESINLGVNKYILKPFNKTTFEKTVYETIELIKLRRAKELYNQELEIIFNTIKDSVCLIDLDFNIKKTNNSFNSLFKYIKGSDLKITELLGDEFKNCLETCKNEASFSNNEVNDLKIELQDGKKLIVNANSSILPNGQVLITFKNITNIKQYEEEIKQYNKLIDEKIITSRTDLDGVITYASKAFEKISGYSKNELIGQKHSIIKNPETPIELHEEIWDTICMNKTWKGEIKNKKKNGETYWVDATISPIFVDNKKVGYSAIREDITSKKALEEMSIKDPLTNIYNRRFFDKTLSRLINVCKRRGENICLLMIDIDYFKLYNDNYGHQKGDKVLISVAQAINNSMRRADDFTFRLGGEEFAVIFISNTKEDALDFAKHVKKAVDNLKEPHKYSTTSNMLTISSGLSFYKASEIISEDDLYKKTDDLLYEAKESGRNKIVTN